MRPSCHFNCSLKPALYHDLAAHYSNQFFYLKRVKYFSTNAIKISFIFLNNITMKITTLLILSVFVLSLELNAQVNEYAFEQKNLSYTEITGGTVLWSGTFDNEVSGAITIPSFTFDGVAYTIGLYHCQWVCHFRHRPSCNQLHTHQ